MSDWLDDWIRATEAEFLFRDREFHEEQRVITHQHIQNGMLHSGSYGLAMFKSLDAAVIARAKLLVSEFHECAAAQSNLGADLEGLDQRVEVVLTKTYDHLYHQTRISDYLAPLSLAKVKEDSELTLRTSIEQTKIMIKRAGAIAMKKQADEAKHVTNVTIHGHGNVVQAGINELTVGLKFDQSTVQNLSAAFEDLRDAIDVSDTPPPLKAELIEVVNDCRTELEKPNPNRMKFTGMLSGLATGIQTVASIKGAWEVFTVAAALAGIVIP